MGITGGIVRSVFSKSRSTKTTENHAVKGNNVIMEKKKWKTSVIRAYLCGDELFDHSVIAEHDSASVKSSEITVTQPVFDDNTQIDEVTSKTVDQERYQKRNVDEETAAIRIQSAFRGFMVRHVRAREGSDAHGFLEGTKSSDKESLATSVEVQTGNSVGIISVIHEEDPSFSNKHHHKPKSLAFRPKEDWDDSTVDSSVSKMRMQNRREAMTRRERALAYAFSQQLRICSKKRPTKSEGTETNMGWSWLERWMATRQQDTSSVEDCMSNQVKEQTPNTLNIRASVLKNKFLDLSFDEKESCGSNEVPVFNNCSKDIAKENVEKIPRNRLKATRNISRRKTVPAYQYPAEHVKANRRDVSKDGINNKRQKMKRFGSNRETPCKDPPSPVQSPDNPLSRENSKSDH